MTQTTRKFFAALLLVFLIVLPFVDWKLGALLWMCAWLIFIFQKLFSRHHWKFMEKNDEEDEPE